MAFLIEQDHATLGDAGMVLACGVFIFLVLWGFSKIIR